MARSNRLLLVGGVVTLLGAALVLVVMLGQSSPDADPVADAGDPPPVSANEPVTPAVQVDAEGAPIFDVPEGMEAVALTVDFQRSVAALPAPGDRVNVYGVFTTQAAELVDDLPDGDGGTPLPAVRRVFSDVLVLAVTGGSHSSNGGAPTFVVALAPEDVEPALFVHTAESIYLSLVDTDTEASPETSGANAGTLGR